MKIIKSFFVPYQQPTNPLSSRNLSSTQSFPSDNPKSTKPLRIIYHNCGGIRGKIKNLYVDAKSCDFDIIIITETWLNDSYTNEEILDNDWTIYRNDRDYKATGLSRGGGVLVAVRNSFSNVGISTIPSKFFEHTFIKITINSKSTYIGAVYIPPNSLESTYNEFYASFHTIHGNLLENDNIFIFGDFNRPNLAFVADESDNRLLPMNFIDDIDFSIIDSFYSNDIQQICKNPNENGRWLDLIFSNDYDNVDVKSANSAENLFSNTLHHTATVVELTATAATFEKSYNKRVVYDFINSDFVSINNAISLIDWTELGLSKDVDNMVKVFYSKIFDIFELHVPKIIKKDKLSEPWLDKNLRTLRNRRNKLYNKINQKIKNNKSPDEELVQKHKELASEFSLKAHEAYNKYVISIGQTLITEPKKFFDFVNLKRNSSGYPSSMFMGDTISSCPSVICDLFADRFREVYNPSDIDTSTENNITTTASPILNSFSLTSEEIYNELVNLDMKKGPGPDLIPPSFLSNCAHQLSIPLSLIFNKSLSLGIFPSLWKSSYLIPIYKNGDKCNVANYRGIAILSSIPKLFEKIICDKMSSIINPLLNDQQHGFRKGRSTTTNLMLFTSYLLCNMEKGHQIDAVYTDFSKAFDRVNHSILISKLRKLGIAGPMLSWLTSYLSNRTQYVKFQGHISSEISASSGVPQGSHLGPLLFNIFICDLSEHLKDIPHLFYADDLKIYHIISTSLDLLFFQSKLKDLEKWCIINKLHLNVSKCHSISFSRKRNSLMHNYQLNNMLLLRVTQITDLGIILDDKLSFKNHYEKIISKAKMLLGFIKRRAKEFNNVWVTKSLFCALVRPILEYACPIWDPHFQVHIDRIESIQKQFLLFALRDLYDPADYVNLPSYNVRLKSINLIPLSSRRTILTSCFTLDVLNGNIDVFSIVNKIKFNDDVRQTRHTTLLKVYSHQKEYARNEPINRCCFTFNTHSSHYSPQIPKSTFKTNLFKSLTLPSPINT